MSERSRLPLNCNHWGTYRVETRDGRVVALHDFEGDPDPSPIGYGMIDALDHPARLDCPAVRRSWLERGPAAGGEARGREPFVRVTWDEAEELVVRELDRVRTDYGNQAIFGGSYGWASAGRFHHAQSQLKRFLNCIGGFTRSVNSYSLAAAEVTLPHLIGPFHDLLDRTTSWPTIVSDCRLLVAFGGLPLRNSQINAGGAASHCQRGAMLEAIRNGVRFVNVSPLRNDLLGEAGADWLAIRPGTDVAAMLGMAHTLLGENLHDTEFLDRYTVGFDKFKAYLTGRADGVPKSADWASGICGIGAADLRNLARRMSQCRTMLTGSWSLTRQDHGEQPYWMLVTLAAMLGQIGLPGGGIGFGYGAVNTIGDHLTIIPAASFPQGDNPVDAFIPVARISDMMLNPGARFDYDGGEYRYPDIKLIYWAGGNPFHHHQDLIRLDRAWRVPQTVIVQDWVWNATAARADIVLPCTTSLERNDLAISRSPCIIHMSKAVEPPKYARNDFDIFKGLARRMGVEGAFTEGRDESEWLAWMYAKTVGRMERRGVKLPDLDELKRMGWHRVEPPPRPNVFLSEFRQDPDRNRLPTPSGRIELHSETVAKFGYSDCPGHAIWLEPAEWLGNRKSLTELHLISNQPATKLHSQLDHGQISRSAKSDGRELITMNPTDASDRGINDNDPVLVHNQRGACLAVARLEDAVRTGVVQMGTGAWFDPGEVGGRLLCKHGNPNVLTLDKGTSRLAQGPIAHTCLVEVSRFEGRLPELTAHDPPEFGGGPQARA